MTNQPVFTHHVTPDMSTKGSFFIISNQLFAQNIRIWIFPLYFVNQSVQHEPMGTKVRPKEPNCIITLTKEGWLSFLVWLVEYGEQAATEEIDKVVQATIKRVREIVLGKETKDEFDLEFDKFNAVDLYVHCKDFRDDIKDGELMLVLKTITGQLKEFLIGRRSE